MRGRKGISLPRAPVAYRDTGALRQVSGQEGLDLGIRGGGTAPEGEEEDCGRWGWVLLLGRWRVDFGADVGV